MELTETVQALRRPMASGDVRLEPMAEMHRAALKAACAEDPDIWAIYSVSWGPDAFDANFDRVISARRWAPFVISSGDRLVGMSCFINVDVDRQVVEIGNTYYVPDMRGSGLNRVVKDLMIRRAFESGIRRIEFRVDIRNQRSQAAMTKIGATREGVLRADRITWTGHVRDTALFSMLPGEWPGT
jgi:RimJ/RimL family protein N-acetyltransferase